MPHDTSRPGSTPIVRVEGDTIVYIMWISRIRGRCEALILRYDSRGELLASLDEDPQACNGNARP